MPPKRPTAISPKGARPRGARPRKSWARGFRRDWLLLGLLGLSLAIRLWGVNQRLPDPSLGVEVVDDSAIEETDRTTMGRAWAMWEGGTKPLDLNPHTGGWPSLSFYLSLWIQYFYRVYFFLAHPGATAADFAGGISSQAVLLFLVARIVGALIGVATVYLTYRLGSRYLGRPVGLIAGLLVGTNTLHILTSQHISDPNLLALFFVLLATESMIRIRQRGRISDSIRAGVMIGLAGACKYVPLVLAFPFALAHRRDAGAALDAPTARSRIPLLRNRAFWYGLLAIPAAVFIASPFLFLDWRRTLIDILNQRDALFSDWVGQTVFPISLPTYLGVSLPHAMGWPAYLLGLAGLVQMWRSGPTARVLVLNPIMIVLANGMLKSPQERYVLVALPYLHLGAAFAIVRGVEWAEGRIASLGHVAPGRPAPTRIGAGILAAAAIAWPLPELLVTRHSLSLPDSRHLSRRWIGQNLDPTKPMAVELYGPVFYDKERPTVTWPFFATQSQLVRPAYHPELLDGLDYYVASGELSRRFGAEAEQYPVENAYYGWLQEHASVVWESDPKTTSGPRITIRRLPRTVSTRAQRDSIFAVAMPKPTRVERLDLWCVDCSRLFARGGDFDRAEEWARRGLKVGVKAREPQLRCALAIALWSRGQLDSAEAEARLAVQGGPQSGPFHMYHGAILADMKRFEPALEEFRKAFQLSGRDPQLRLSIGESLGRLRESIQLDPNQQRADLVRQQIAQLEAELGP